jgi:hypothetical protein
VSKKDWRSTAGQVGGKAAAAAMSPEERTERARQAATARWATDAAPVDAERKARLHRTLDYVLDILEGKRQATPEDTVSLRDLRRILARGKGK